MPKLSKRFVERFKDNFRKYRKIPQSAKTMDVNDSDTVVIVTDFLLRYLIEVKLIGRELPARTRVWIQA